MEVYPLSPKSVLYLIAKMFSKTSLALALVCFCHPLSSFAAGLSVPPNSGGEGIQSALDALPAGGEVVLSAGRYSIHQPLILQKDHQTLRGCGTATVLYLADEANCPVVVLGSPLACANAPVKDVCLANLFIDGNRKNQQKEVWRFVSERGGLYNNGVDIWDVDGAMVEGVVCCRCRSGGMVSSAGTRRLTVRDYTAFDNQFDGLACYLTEDSDFSHLNLHDNLSAGISLDLDFNHNVIHDSVLTGNDLGIFMRQSRNNVFEGLTIQKSRHHGVFMAQTFVGSRAGWLACPGSECAGNTFDNLVVAHCGGKGFLVNDATCTNNVICGGQFADDAQGGLAQAVPNLVTMCTLAEPVDPGRLEAAMPVVHQLPEHVAAAQIPPKAL
jgi:polygalacturonase